MDTETIKAQFVEAEKAVANFQQELVTQGIRANVKLPPGFKTTIEPIGPGETTDPCTCHASESGTYQVTMRWQPESSAPAPPAPPNRKQRRAAQAQARRSPRS